METIGERRVRFNPSENTEVFRIKKDTAGLIDLIDRIKDRDPRLAAMAQSRYEEAAMWAVKLATT